MKKNDEPQQVGWLVDAEFGSVIFSPPTSVKSSRSKPLSRRAIQACPAINLLENGLYEIKCPFNLSLTLESAGENFNLYFDEKFTRLDTDLLGKHIVFMPQNQWRDSKKPVIQILLPYVFLSDEECYVNQYPPFLDDAARQWPGYLVAGRFPCNIWPRTLNWAFEWTDPGKELRLSRGQTLFYVKIDGTSPSREINLVRAENTQDLKKYRKAIEATPKYMSNTFQLFDDASAIRPKVLLKEISNNG